MACRGHPALDVAPRLCLLVALVSAGIALDAQRVSRDYVQWRGAQRDGSASAFVEPKQWPDALTRRWKVDVGEGYATPLIVGDSVYVFTRLDGQEGITALEASTAAVSAGDRSYAAPYTPSQACGRTRRQSEGDAALPRRQALHARHQRHRVGFRRAERQATLAVGCAEGGAVLWRRCLTAR